MPTSSAPDPAYRELSTADFQTELAELARRLRDQIEAHASGFDPTPAACRKRADRATKDFGVFCDTYFPHYLRGRRVRGPDGKFREVPVRPSRLHRWLRRFLPWCAAQEDEQRWAIAAPRGEAKSTYLLLYVLWCIATNRRRYVIYIMDTLLQAAKVLLAIKVELTANPRLRSDFPEACGQGTIWQAHQVVTAGGVLVEAAGTGINLRGRRHGAWRPDLVIADDIENDENVRSKDFRDNQEQWVTGAVEELGEAGEKCDILLIGTVLHFDAVLMRLRDNPTWRSRVFQSVVRWPDRMDLWDRWEETLRNDGPRAAAAFLAAHGADMHRGAVVSWPDKRPLAYLMRRRAGSHRSFDREHQQSPQNPDGIFHAFTWWVATRPEWRMFGAVDPSLGKNGKKGDPSAILVGGLLREEGTLDVIEASIRRRAPETIISDIIALQAEHECLVWFVEAVQFQEFLRTQLMKESVRRHVPISAVPVIPHTDKDLRIETLSAPITDGLIRVHASQTTLIDQLRNWPDGHDDGPDALEMLWKNAVRWAAPTEIRGGGRRAAGSAALNDYLISR